jgi:diketogulonate reductase-like aldo/keto reductase
MSDVRVLADGNEIPVLGLGVWQISDGPVCVDAVRWALELGYRHIDTAQAYGNEESVGRALRDSGVPREQVFITTKFYPRNGDPVAAIEQSLRRLGVGRVDLYLVHWPANGPTWAWPGMERARELGHARSIGVSNFNVDELDEVKSASTIPPAVNQIELSPVRYRRALLEACASQDVVPEAYSPLGTGKHLSSKTVRRIAEQLDRTPAQVLLRWCLQRSLVVIPKSTHRERIASNAEIFDFALSDSDMAELDGLDKTDGTGRALERIWWLSAVSGFRTVPVVCAVSGLCAVRSGRSRRSPGAGRAGRGRSFRSSSRAADGPGAPRTGPRQLPPPPPAGPSRRSGSARPPRARTASRRARR